MYVTISVIFLSVIFVIIDLIPLYRKEEWSAFFLYGTLLVLSMVLAVLMDMRVEMPNPTEPLKKIVEFFIGPVEP